MANATTHIVVKHDARIASATIADQYVRPSSDKMGGLSRLAKLFNQILGGARNAAVTVFQDVDGAQGTQTITFTQASVTAGDLVYIGPVGFRAVSGAVTAGQDTFSLDTSDTAVGDSFVAALAANTFVNQYVTASNAAGVVTLTCRIPGPVCHMIAIRKAVTTAAGIKLGANTSITETCFSAAGGTKASGTVTIDFAKLDDGDTVTVAGSAVTAETGSVDPGEFALQTDSTTTAADLVRELNSTSGVRCHGVWTSTLGVATFTAHVPGTGLDGMTLASSDADGAAVSAATLTDGATSAASAARTYSRGV